eukprot:2273174-Prymnesium_polylepis.1
MASAPVRPRLTRGSDVAQSPLCRALVQRASPLPHACSSRVSGAAGSALRGTSGRGAPSPPTA